MIDYVSETTITRTARSACTVWIESLQNDLRMTFDVVHNKNNRFLSLIINSD
jgi:hypothetical protein